MSGSVKFSTKIEKKTLRELKSYTRASKRKIASVVSEAVSEYLERVHVRPAFREAAQRIVIENEELLRRLADK